MEIELEHLLETAKVGCEASQFGFNRGYELGHKSGMVIGMAYGFVIGAVIVESIFYFSGNPFNQPTKVNQSQLIQKSLGDNK